MTFRRISLALRIFFLLVASVLTVQIVNIALLLVFPPLPEPVFSLAEIRMALDQGASIDRLRVTTLPAAEVKPQDERLRELRDRLAFRLGLQPASLNIEFAHRPTSSEIKADKGTFEASRLVPLDAPHSGQVDPDSFAFSGHFKIARILDDGTWRVISPADSLRALWQRRAIVLLIVTVVLSIPLAYFLASWLSVPIRRFGAAAERLGRNLREPPIRTDGPPEIAGAAEAFNRMSERLSRYVDDRVAMMGAIAHDLRTPLTRLSFRIDSMPEPARAKAEADVDEMRTMLAAVLEFVRALQGDRPRQRQELRSLITSIADDQQDMGKKVIVEDGPDVVLVGDNLGLRSLFTNLIENAVAYGGTASVRLLRQDNQAIVEVDDEGPGLANEELEKVFEPFYRAEPSRNRRTGGMGLGLALVRSVAVAHGGHAWLENRIGKGLRARVTLPI